VTSAILDANQSPRQRGGEPKLSRKLRPLGKLVAFIGSVFDQPPPTLAPYFQPLSPNYRKVRQWLMISIIAIASIIYGFLVAIFPISFYVFLALPLGILALIVIWVLPERRVVPAQAFANLFFLTVVTVCFWPNYIAIAIPGLPWITFVRLWTMPMTLLLLISASTSVSFRRNIIAWTKTSPWVFRGLVTYVLLGVATLPMSAHPGTSLNTFVINQFEWTAVFLVGCYVFIKPGRVTLWAQIFCGFVIFQCLLSVLERKLGYVPWAHHIPSFFKTEEGLVETILAGGTRAATGTYRVQSIFTTSLSFAEFIALSTPFMIYFMQHAKLLIVRIGLAIYIPFSAWIIYTTSSRLGFVGFFAAIFMYLLLWGLKSWSRHRTGLTGPAVVLAYPAVLAAFITLSFAWRRLEVMVWGGGAEQSSNDARQFQWEHGIDQLLKWPLGYGTGQSGEVVGYYDLAGKLSLDSYYIAILIDLGIIGFVAYYGMLLAAGWKAVWSGLATKDDETEMLVPLGIMIAVFTIVKIVLSQEDNHTLVFMALAAIVALLHRIKNEMVAYD
jgi:O-antigen ligase